jgi:hypothetical protein
MTNPVISAVPASEIGPQRRHARLEPEEFASRDLEQAGVPLIFTLA